MFDFNLLLVSNYFLLAFSLIYWIFDPYNECFISSKECPDGANTPYPLDLGAKLEPIIKSPYKSNPELSFFESSSN